MKKGKLICKTLKDVRKKVADANGIEYTPTSCDFQGDCMGTCPMCEAEVRYLEQELEKKKSATGIVHIAGVAELDKEQIFDNECEEKRCSDDILVKSREYKKPLMGKMGFQWENVESPTRKKKKKHWYQRLADLFPGGLIDDELFE